MPISKGHRAIGKGFLGWQGRFCVWLGGLLKAIIRFICISRGGFKPTFSIVFADIKFVYVGFYVKYWCIVQEINTFDR
jgi:hypothetical protein